MLFTLLLQAAPAVCPSTPAPLPPALAGWSRSVAVAASTAGTSTLSIGRGAQASLLPAASVSLAVPVRSRPPSGSFAGLFAFEVTRAGRYRVALDAGVWIDVVAGGHALPSAAHAHGPACSPVRKVVDYDLQPGRYLLQIVGSASPRLRVLIAG